MRRLRWLGLMSCLCARSLPAQSGGEANRPQLPAAKSDSPTPAARDPQSDPAGGKSSQPSLVPPPQRAVEMTPDPPSANGLPAHRRPLTVREKFVLSLHQSFDFNEHVVNALQAALQQAANGQPHYGEGWGAFGERFAASEGDQITGSTLVYGVLPSILHEDPRYFRRSRGSTLARVWYAMNRTFVTRRDDGTSGFNNSEMFGQLISCGISTSYYPPQDRTVGRLFSNWAVNLGGNSAYNVFSEYYPEVVRGLFHRHPKPTVPASGD